MQFLTLVNQYYPLMPNDQVHKISYLCISSLEQRSGLAICIITLTTSTAQTWSWRASRIRSRLFCCTFYGFCQQSFDIHIKKIKRSYGKMLFSLIQILLTLYDVTVIKIHLFINHLSSTGHTSRIFNSLKYLSVSNGSFDTYSEIRIFIYKIRPNLL